MAESTSSQHRAQLIREMSRDMNRSRNSSGSSRHSQSVASPEPTTSDFDPENEAMLSTRHLDSHSQHLPELRASANKHTRSSPPAEPDFAINTSAIGRAFPNFSQGGSSSEDDSMSIEIGRGARKGSNGTIGKLGRSRGFSSNAQLSFEGDSMDFSAPMIGNYEVTTTPPLRQRQTSTEIENGKRGSPKRDAQARKPSGLQKETFGPSPPPAKTTDYGSGENRKPSGDTRHTLASMHARLREENDQSRLDDGRPATSDLSARNTRFGNTKNLHLSSQGALPTRFSSAQTLLDHVAPVSRKKAQVMATPNQGTQQSFMLPDLPNISELVSGVFEDGTPVFSRYGKSRASRFVSSSQHIKSNGRDYLNVNEIPIPDDEQAIFLSLKLLQDKVVTLEKSNVEAANNIDDLEQRNRALESEKNDRRRNPRSDSALGTTDSDEGRENGGSRRGLLIEKNRLESSARALKREVDAGKRKYSTAEAILKNITGERDSAISQLGVAFITIEQLKVENESLKAENDDLKARFGQLDKQHEHESEKRTGEQAAPPNHHDQRSKTIESISKGAGTRRSSVKNAKDLFTNRVHGPSNTASQDVEILVHKDVDTMFDLSSRQDANDLRAKDAEHSQANEDLANVPQKGKGKGEASARSFQKVQSSGHNEASQDLTYLSFLDNREIAQLRRTLEQERIERKQCRNLSTQTSKANFTTTKTGLEQPKTQSTEQKPPRKSSMKDLTSRSVKYKEPTEAAMKSQEQLEDIRRHSDTSILSIRSRRRGLGVENMTSAFIVPDITMSNPGFLGQDSPKLTKEAKEIIDGLTNHANTNCTVCKRFSHPNDDHEHGATTKDTIKISKPVPVSGRMPKSTEEDGDATIRPAQPPGLALATVLKELEDELAHLKIQLSQYQVLYNGHDPALSKRRRKSVQQQIESVLQAIDVKADQIYALYDVLEGQKQDGHEISEEEVEVTLQSIGIKAPELHLRGGGEDEQDDTSGDEKPSERHPWDLESEGDASEDLPWEGIETTVETTKSGFARAARKANSRG